jgi:hypothetical protein
MINILDKKTISNPLEVKPLKNRRDTSPFLKDQQTKAVHVVSTGRFSHGGHPKRNSFNVSDQVSPMRSPSRLRAQTNKN